MLRQYIALQSLIRTRRDERGATAVEYGLMIALIAVAIILIVGTLGEQLAQMFQGVSDKLPAVPED